MLLVHLVLGNDNELYSRGCTANQRTCFMTAFPITISKQLTSTQTNNSFSNTAAASSVVSSYQRQTE